MVSDLQVFIGWDTRERLAWNVCARSLAGHASIPPPIAPIGMQTLGGAYARETTRRGTRLWDVASRAPMSTEFALARFWAIGRATAPWALFCDADFLWRGDVWQLLDHADPRCAVMVVKHRQQVGERRKMDGQAQSGYERKNWSSLMLINTRHAGNRRLWAEDLNGREGLWLHQFRWLRDEEIGELPPQWNVLDGQPAPLAEPMAYHYTLGTPDMLAKPLPYSDEWWRWLTPLEIRQYEESSCQPSFAPAPCAIG